MTKEETEFLQESNKIEGVYDTASLKQAQVAWKYLKGQQSLSVSVILKTHKLLMLHQPLRPDEKGYFRKVPVYIGGREGAPWRMIGPLMWKWTFEGMRANPPIDPKQLHVEYEKIHPFVDGNGRTGRMFLNWQRLKRTKEPLLIIHAGTLEQSDYYSWFA